MSKLKVHYEIIETPPSESDPGGYSYSACGREYFERGAGCSNMVTCKMCLKRLAKKKP